MQGSGPGPWTLRNDASLHSHHCLKLSCAGSMLILSSCSMIIPFSG